MDACVTFSYILVHEYRCMCTRKYMAERDATQPSNSPVRCVPTVGNITSRNAVCTSKAQKLTLGDDVSIWNAGGSMSPMSLVTRALRDIRNFKPWTHVKQCWRFACYSRFNRHSSNDPTLFYNEASVGNILGFGIDMLFCGLKLVILAWNFGAWPRYTRNLPKKYWFQCKPCISTILLTCQFKRGTFHAQAPKGILRTGCHDMHSPPHYISYI